MRRSIGVVIALAGACGELREAEQQAESRVDAGRGGPVPVCSLVSWPELPPPLLELGCSRTVNYKNGYLDGFLGGRGSMCPDTPALRAAVVEAQYGVYGPGTYDACLTVPAGKLFAFWVRDAGPGCPSSCLEDHAPWPGPPP